MQKGSGDDFRRRIQRLRSVPIRRWRAEIEIEIEIQKYHRLLYGENYPYCSPFEATWDSVGFGLQNPLSDNPEISGVYLIMEEVSG